MEELGWHKPPLQIQHAGKTAFFPSLSFFLFLIFLLPFPFFPLCGFKALLQGIALSRCFIPNIYFYMHQVTIVPIYPSVLRGGYIHADTSSLSQPGSLNKMRVAWSCRLQKKLLSRSV